MSVRQFARFARTAASPISLLAHRARNSSAVALRRWYYGGAGRAKIWEHVPDRLLHRLGFDDATAITTRRIEIGPGPYPTAGHLHVDIDSEAMHLEAVAPMWKLPFDDDWATDLRAVHVLEHVHPSQLETTLLEWRRVLAPGGKLLVSVPNGPAIMDAFKQAPVPEKWPLAGSILGMYCGPDLRDPRDLKARSDHQIVFDWDLLAWALEIAGFSEIEDLSDEWEDRHSVWNAVVERYSLVAQATAA